MLKVFPDLFTLRYATLEEGLKRIERRLAGPTPKVKVGLIDEYASKFPPFDNRHFHIVTVPLDAEVAQFVRVRINLSSDSKTNLETVFYLPKIRDRKLQNLARIRYMFQFPQEN